MPKVGPRTDGNEEEDDPREKINGAAEREWMAQTNINTLSQLSFPLRTVGSGAAS